MLIAVILISGCADNSEAIRQAEIQKHLNDLKDENAYSSSVTQAGLYFNFIAPEGVEVVPDLLEFLGMNINIEAHLFIIEAFITMGDAANEIILDSLDDENPTIRAGAAYTLCFIPMEPEYTFDKLITMLGDEDPAVRRNAAAAIQASGPLNDDPIPSLTKLLDDADPTVRAQAAHTLGIYCSDDGIRQTVISKLNDESSLVRAGAAAGLELAGPEAKSVTPKLFEMLNDEDTEVRRKVIHALVAISPEDPEVTMKLIERLGFEGESKHIVIHSFAKIGPYAEPAVPNLIDILMWNESPALQTDAAYALGHIGPVAFQAIPALIKALDDTDDGLRWNAATSLGLIGYSSEEAITALQKTADNDANDEVRMVAADAIEKIRRNK